MKLRSYLVALTLTAVLPLALFAAVIGAYVIGQGRETFHRGTQERLLALSTAVDAELNGHVTTLRALAHAKSLDLPDLALFRGTVEQILRSQTDWITINLALPNGQQVLDVLLPDGAALPLLAETVANLERLTQQRQPVIGDLVLGPTTRRWDFAVRVPVIRERRVTYILSAVVEPASFGRLLSAQRLPSDWGGVVLDPAGRVVARTSNHESTRGDFAPPDLREAVTFSPSGRLRARTADGVDVYRVFTRSDVTGWTVAMELPASAVDATAQRAIATFAMALLAVTIVATTLALLLGRRISRPMAALAAATDALAQGQRPTIAPSTQITELRSLERALQAAVGAQEALRCAEEALREADRQKDEFVAMIGHELRSPLNALTAAARVLRTAPQNGTARHAAIAVVERQTRHMTRVVEDLLDVTRLRMGKITLEPEMLDLAQVTAEVLNAWREAGRFEGRAVVRATLTSACITGDRARVEQVLSNLLDNALKFTPPGGMVEVIVRQDNDSAVLRVTDSGRGIEPASLARIFGSFVQGEHDSGDRERGLGLGLTIVRRLVELHRGTVAAESEGLGRGASFTVRFAITSGAADVVDIHLVRVNHEKAAKQS